MEDGQNAFKRTGREKGDERIWGDIEFDQSVLERCDENYSRRERLIAYGVDLKTLSDGVADNRNNVMIA